MIQISQFETIGKKANPSGKLKNYRKLNKLLSESIENKTNSNHLNQHQLGKKPIPHIFDDKRQEEMRERKIHDGQTVTTTAQS